MGSTPTAFVDETGIHVPAFPDVLAYFRDAYRAIYGSDVYIEPDSQDGQFLGILAAAVADANAMAVQVYNAFSPATAQGTGLSSVVKINGIARQVPSTSTADLLIVGQAGSIITDGIVTGAETDIGWALPPTVVIPYEGQILVTASCLVAGAVTAAANTITTIVNTQPGWQTVTNPNDATPGKPVENDALLRRRQAISTELPAQSILGGLRGALASLPGIGADSLVVYENTTNISDEDGIPGHCIAVVIDGGDAAMIAQTIRDQKGGGVGTYGDQVRTVIDEFGVPRQIAFFRPTSVQIAYDLQIVTYPGFTIDIQNRIAQALADWTKQLGVGTDIRRTRAFVPAYLDDVARKTFEITRLAVSRDGLMPTEDDVIIAFNERAFSDPSLVTIHVPLGVI